MDAINVLDRVVSLLMKECNEISEQAKKEENPYTKSALAYQGITLKIIAKNINQALQDEDAKSVKWS